MSPSLPRDSEISGPSRYEEELNHRPEPDTGGLIPSIHSDPPMDPRERGNEQEINARGYWSLVRYCIMKNIILLCVCVCAGILLFAVGIVFIREHFRTKSNWNGNAGNYSAISTTEPPDVARNWSSASGTKQCRDNENYHKGFCIELDKTNRFNHKLSKETCASRGATLPDPRHWAPKEISELCGNHEVHILLHKENVTWYYEDGTQAHVQIEHDNPGLECAVVDPGNGRISAVAFSTRRYLCCVRSVDYQVSSVSSSSQTLSLFIGNTWLVFYLIGTILYDHMMYPLYKPEHLSQRYEYFSRTKLWNTCAEDKGLRLQLSGSML